LFQPGANVRLASVVSNANVARWCGKQFQTPSMNAAGFDGRTVCTERGKARRQ